MLLICAECTEEVNTKSRSDSGYQQQEGMIIFNADFGLFSTLLFS
jgi:hypothetical protein